MKAKITIAAMILALSSAMAQLQSSHAPVAAAAPNAVQAAPAQLPASLQVTGRPVARVNNAVLTDRDLLREMLTLFPYARLHGGFPKAQEADIRRGAMQMIIFEELVYQEARRRGMTIAPARLQHEEQQFRGQFASDEEFKTYLQSEMGGSEAKLRQQIKRSLLITALLKTEVEDKSVITTAAARAYYQKNPKEFEHGELIAFQSISILPPKNASASVIEDSRKKAQDIWKQAKATTDYEQFGLLAEKVSEDDFRVNMGDHHAVKAVNLPPEIVKTVGTMKAGDVSNLIQLGNAFTMLRLNAHIPAGTTRFADVKKVLTDKLQKQKSEQLRVALDKRLHQGAKIEELDVGNS